MQVFVEYVLLAHVNDGEEQGQQLGALLQGRAVVLNLIPWNPVYSPNFHFQAPGQQRTEAFHRVVRKYGVHCTVRQEKGQDIAGTFVSYCLLDRCNGTNEQCDVTARYVVCVNCTAYVMHTLIDDMHSPQMLCRRMWAASRGAYCKQRLWLSKEHRHGRSSNWSQGLQLAPMDACPTDLPEVQNETSGMFASPYFNRH